MMLGMPAQYPGQCAGAISLAGTARAGREVAERQRELPANRKAFGQIARAEICA